MVIAFEGYAKGNKVDQVIVPVIHLAAGMLVRSQIFNITCIVYILYWLGQANDDFFFFSWFLLDIGEFCIGRLCDRHSSSLPCGIFDSCALWKNGLAKVVGKPEPKQRLTVIWPRSQVSSKITLEQSLASFYLLTWFLACKSHSSLSPNCFET